MSPGNIAKRIILHRIDWFDRMIHEIQSLPLSNFDIFSKDSRNIWTAESCLRRALESLFDIGRHILAKGFGSGVSEYKEIARSLSEKKILSKRAADTLFILAGYRNRLVHFYSEVTNRELFDICKEKLNEPVEIRNAFLKWLKNNPDKMDDTL